MGEENYFPFGYEEDYPPDEYEDLSGFVWNAPKQSSMHRGSRSRMKEFEPREKQDDRKKINRKSIRYDFGYWEG